jgi:hypothetical protein
MGRQLYFSSEEVMLRMAIKNVSTENMTVSHVQADVKLPAEKAAATVTVIVIRQHQKWEKKLIIWRTVTSSCKVL